MSYLAGEKQKLSELVDGLREEVAKAESVEALDGLFKAWKDDCWRLFEEGMKKSFANGKLAARQVGGNGGTEKKPFAWKRPREV